MRNAMAFLLLGLLSMPLSAQTPLDLARALRERGDLHGAVNELRAHIAAHPDDAVAHALLGETSYWLQQFDSAAASYGRALDLDADNESIRLQFGRMLVEIRRFDRAREVLHALTQRSDATGAEALYLVGTTWYWSGDLARARARFQDALALAPEHEGAARALGEIRATLSPWFRIDPTGASDTQTLTRVGTSAGAGLFLTPRVVLDVDAEYTRFAWSDSATAVSTGGAGLRVQVAGSPLTVEAGAGMAHWSLAAQTRLTARATARLALARNASLSAEFLRAPYTNTTASLTAPQLPDRFVLRLALDAPSGWTGEAAARVERFGDGNRTRAVWAWLLAPLARGSAADLRIGWQIGWQDAQESRFALASSSTLATGERRFTGRYVPYYTAERILSHGPAAALAVRPSSSVTFDANGSWGLHAAEDAPYWFAADSLPESAPVRGIYRRTFHPLEVRAALRIVASTRTTLFLEGTHARTAFYDDSRARAGILVRLLPPER